MATNQSPGAPVAAESAVPTLRVMRLQSPELYQVGHCCVRKLGGHFIQPKAREKHWNQSFRVATEFSAVILDVENLKECPHFIFSFAFRNRLQPYAGSFEHRCSLGTAMCLPDSLGGKLYFGYATIPSL